jgi:hypothetical protein
VSVQSSSRNHKQLVEQVALEANPDLYPKEQRTPPPHPTKKSFRNPAVSIDAHKHRWPITPPQDAGGSDYRCIVDHGRKPFSVTWRGSPQYPDLCNCPTLDCVEVSPVPLSPALATIWADSELLDYGSHASVRVSEHTHFPILKLAHPDAQSFALIKDDFNVLADLKLLGLPIPEIDTQPIADGGRICSYQMKMLVKLKPAELRCRRHDIQDGLLRLHSAGFCGFYHNRGTA